MQKLIASCLGIWLSCWLICLAHTANAQIQPREPSETVAATKDTAKSTKKPKHRVEYSISELVGFRWNYFGLSHEFTFDATIRNLWGSDHILLDSYLSLGVKHYFSSQNALRFYVAFQPVSIFDLYAEGGIFHTYGSFDAILRAEQYGEYSKEHLTKSKTPEGGGSVVETKMGLSLKFRARLKLKFWKFIIANSFGMQFYSMYGFNDDTYKIPRMYYYESIFVKHLYANDTVIFNDTHLFFEVFNNTEGRRKLLLGLYNEYNNAINYRNGEQRGDASNKLGLIGIWTPIEHVAMPTIIMQFKIWLLDRYKGLYGRAEGEGPPEFEFVAALSWDFKLN